MGLRMAKSGRASRAGPAKTNGADSTRRALVDAAIESLRFDGFSGASARAIAARAGVNPGLIFYHFGSVADLLLAGLAEVSERRMARYSAAVAAANTAAQLVAVATDIFREDLDEGYATVLVEMIAGAGSSPELGEQVAALIAPWRAFAQRAIEAMFAASPLASLVPIDDAAHAVVALYLGLEMLSHVDGDREPALRLFDQASRLVDVVGALTGSLPGKDPR
jgi:AcrR family transcriptional regulator